MGVDSGFRRTYQNWKFDGINLNQGVAGSKPARLINELKKHIELFLCALTINLLLFSLLPCNVIKIYKRNSNCQ
jgi:hypothetical protein